MTLVAQRADGTIVNSGDDVVSFRGETMTFLAPERARRESGLGGKVTVEQDGRQRTFNDTVFDLAVTEEGNPGDQHACPCGRTFGKGFGLRVHQRTCRQEPAGS